MEKYIFNLRFFLIYILFFTPDCPSQSSNSSPIPDDSNQMILVLTDSASATNGYLYRLEKRNKNGGWELIKEKIPIVLGRNGMACGRGLNSIDTSKLAVKTEGDGKSPDGVFKLSSAFGYSPADEMRVLKTPYIHVTEMTECIDDIKSAHYNEIVLRSEIENVDWQSSEKMFYADIYYEQGVIVDQNMDPVMGGSGSCIFLHNWSVPDETSSGCTEMEPINMKEIIFWLDSSSNPVLVQLTHQPYIDCQQLWGLPDIIWQHEL